MQDLIEELFQLRSEIALVNRDTLKPLETRKKEVEEELMRLLDEAGVDGTKIKGIGSVTVNEEVVPSAEDWSLVYAYIQEHGAFHLLNRALNAAAYRESLTVGEEIPGLVPFRRKKLSVRAA